MCYIYNDEVFGVLDIDSPLKDRFSEKDKEGLESFAKILERQMKCFSNGGRR